MSAPAAGRVAEDPKPVDQRDWWQAWAEEVAAKETIDWAAASRAAETALNAMDYARREVTAQMPKNPATEQLAGLCALATGFFAFAAHLKKERIAKEQAKAEKVTADDDKEPPKAPAGKEPPKVAAQPKGTPSAPSPAVPKEVLEAASLLGVSPDAPVKEIRRAFRAKMVNEQLHPDHGGDPEVARRVVAARDLLIKRAQPAKVQS